MKKATSAGGVLVKIIGNHPHILLIRDKKYQDWVLPKGHVEEGETIEEAALREVREEAGLSKVKIVTSLGVAKRYVEKADEQKTIHYFLMTLTENQEPQINDENSKDEIKWFDIENLPNFFLQEQEKIIKDNLDLLANYK